MQGIWNFPILEPSYTTCCLFCSHHCLRFWILSHTWDLVFSVFLTVKLALLGESHLHLTTPHQWLRHQVDGNRHSADGSRSSFWPHPQTRSLSDFQSNLAYPSHIQAHLPLSYPRAKMGRWQETSAWPLTRLYCNTLVADTVVPRQALGTWSLNRSRSITPHRSTLPFCPEKPGKHPRRAPRAGTGNPFFAWRKSSARTRHVLDQKNKTRRTSVPPFLVLSLGYRLPCATLTFDKRGRAQPE